GRARRAALGGRRWAIGGGGGGWCREARRGATLPAPRDAAAPGAAHPWPWPRRQGATTPRATTPGSATPCRTHDAPRPEGRGASGAGGAGVTFRPRTPVSGEDLAQERGGLGRRLADLHADGLQGLLLRLGGARRAGDDGAGVAHRLALGRGEARDVADDRLRDVLLDVGRGTLLGVAADLADHDDRLGLGVVLERLERVDVRGADDRVAADADGGREPEVLELVHHLVGQRARLGHETDRALARDGVRGDAGERLARRDDAGAVRADHAR